MERKEKGVFPFTRPGTLLRKEELNVLKEASEGLNVRIKTIGEGRAYEYREPAEWHQGENLPYSYKGIVPKDHVFVRLEAQSFEELNAFDEKVEKIRQKQQDSNLPK